MDVILKIVRRYRPAGRVSIRRIGSFVNDVFLVKVDNEKLVAKRYTNWVSLKWVTLSLFGLGSVHFSISGKRRMEAEYAFNDLLSRRGRYSSRSFPATNCRVSSPDWPRAHKLDRESGKLHTRQADSWRVLIDWRQPWEIRSQRTFWWRRKGK